MVPSIICIRQIRELPNIKRPGNDILIYYRHCALDSNDHAQQAIYGGSVEQAKPEIERVPSSHEALHEGHDDTCLFLKAHQQS